MRYYLPWQRPEDPEASARGRPCLAYEIHADESMHAELPGGMRGPAWRLVGTGGGAARK